MLKAFGAAVLLVSALAMTADPARALQVVVTQVDKNTDGSMTYHFAVKTDPGETLLGQHGPEMKASTRSACSRRLTIAPRRLTRPQ